MEIKAKLDAPEPAFSKYHHWAPFEKGSKWQVCADCGCMKRLEERKYGWKVRMVWVYYRDEKESLYASSYPCVVAKES